MTSLVWSQLPFCLFVRQRSAIALFYQIKLLLLDKEGDGVDAK